MKVGTAAGSAVPHRTPVPSEEDGEEGLSTPSLRIRHFIAPARVGGAERVVEALCAGLLERGHRIEVCPVISVEPSDHPFVIRLREAGIPVRPIRVAARSYLAEWRKAAGILRSAGADVVHTHGARPDLVDGSAALFVGRPVVSTVHGFTDATLRLRMYRRLQEWAYRRFDGVVAVSRPLAVHLEERGVPRKKLHVVPNAWDGDDDLLEPREARRRLRVDGDAFHVGWVGRLGPEKGADVLLRAVARLDDLPVVVSVVGEGGEEPELRELARNLGLEGRVSWHGEVAEARRYFPGFDAFVLSSRREGTPMVLLEALAAEVPVVSTRVGGVPDVVSFDEALLVPPEDSAALARALRRIHDAPDEARERARRGLERLEAERGREAWIDGYESVYRSILTNDETAPRRRKT